LDQLIQHLRRVILLPDAVGQSDRQLLERFRRRGDAVAFEALLRRHGPMVFGVCRRVLGNHHDAEDAFQATFLVLIRKSSSVNSATLANWLFGVAYRVARKAKARADKSREREQRAAATAPTERLPDLWSDLPAALDEELHRLTDKYRIPFILCELEGHSQRDAAHELGWPEGTLFVRLMRAKKLLATRLSERGFGPAAGAVAVLASANGALANVPAPLTVSTVKAAAALAAGQTAAGLVSAKVTTLVEGVLSAMFFSNLKSLTVMFLMGLAGAGVAVSFGALRAGQEAAPPIDSKKPAAPEPAKKVPIERAPERLVPVNLEIRKAVDARIKALREAVDARSKELALGKATVPDPFIAADRLLLAAELDICTTDQARQECAQRALTRVEPHKERLELKFRAGTIGPSNYYFFLAHYYDVVTIFERAKVNAAMGRPAAGDHEARQEARRAELVAYRQAFETRLREYETGKTTTVDFLCEAQRRLFVAECRVCKTAAERLTCAKRAFEFSKTMLDSEKKRIDAGITTGAYPALRGQYEEFRGELLGAQEEALVEEEKKRLSPGNSGDH
jgi:RNA polymerase sigma factor (sigma-70 family)